MRLPERPAARLGLTALLGAAGVLCFAPFGLFWLALTAVRTRQSAMTDRLDTMATCEDM